MKVNNNKLTEVAALRAGLNRQETTQTVIDLANTLSKGLAHLSPEDRLDLARKMLEGRNNL